MVDNPSLVRGEPVHAYWYCSWHPGHVLDIKGDGGALQPAVVFEPMSTAWADYWKNTFWKDYESIVPDSGKHLDGIPGNCSLYTVASTFKMHPLMLSCWTCLLHDAVHWSQINIRLQKFVEHFRPRMHIPRALSISLSRVTPWRVILG